MCITGPHNERELLLGTLIEGRMEGKKTRGRPRMMSLDWMIMKGDYGKLKERAGHQRRHWS